MAERKEPRPPVVSVSDPRTPGAPVDVLGHDDGGPGRLRVPPWVRRLLVAAALVAVAVVVGVNLRAAHQRSQLAAEQRDLRLTVGVGVALAPGRPAPVVDAVVSLVVRSSGTVPVRVVGEQVDGGPLQPTDGPGVAAGEARALTVRWRVRCAEVGQVRGPIALTLHVTAPHGRHVLRFPLLAGAATFHAAAVAACTPP